ncbi:MAG: hypothetical protein EAZ14_03920 [Runella slithyformis]|nr:MAG: hypothetical protein EAZ14_03920 [Runella slithyformis]
MKAYNETWIKNAAIQAQAENWQQQGLLAEADLQKIKTALPDESYQPIVWIKIGLFIFTNIAFLFGSAFMGLGGFYEIWGVWAFINAAVAIFVLELFIKNRKLRHSGVDNALLYIGLGAVAGCFFSIFETSPNAVAWCMLPVLAVAVYRYADVVAALALLITFFYVLSTILFESTIGKMLAPFVFMAVSGLIYALVRRKDQQFKFLYWANCCWVLEVAALILLYVSGNYAVVRAGSEALLGSQGEIQFAPLFWVFTFVIPLVYVWFSVRQKDRKLLIIGLLCLVSAVITFRTYHAIVPTEIALLLGGLFLLVSAVLLIPTPTRHGGSNCKAWCCRSLRSKPSSKPPTSNWAVVTLAVAVRAKSTNERKKSLPLPTSLSTHKK